MRKKLVMGDEHMKPLVIFLNGTSSAGKTSIALALQSLHSQLLLHTGIDTLYDMLPQWSVGEVESAKGGYRYVMRNGILDHIEIGPVAQKLLACTVPLTTVLLDHQLDVVIDEILFAGEGRTFLHDYADAFSQSRAYFVKVACDLTVLEQREQSRGNRHTGLARMQYAHVHNHGYAYDIVVDSSKDDAATCAKQIVAYMQKNKEPQAFAAIRARKKNEE